MARKRVKLKGIDYQSREYWNKLLSEEGLTMSQGLHPKLSYQGSSQEVETLAGAIEMNTGRIKAKEGAE